MIGQWTLAICDLEVWHDAPRRGRNNGEQRGHSTLLTGAGALSYPVPHQQDLFLSDSAEGTGMARLARGEGICS